MGLIVGGIKWLLEAVDEVGDYLRMVLEVR